MDASSIEHVVISAKLGDLIGLQLIQIAEQKASFHLTIFCSGHRNGTNSQRLGEIHLWAWDLHSMYTIGVGVECTWKPGVRYTWESSWRRSIWAPPKGGEAATVTCSKYRRDKTTRQCL